MTDARFLPPEPHLDHLRKQAKHRLAVMRSAAPDTRLADAQFCVARDYGFSSWRALKAEVDRRSLDGRPPAPQPLFDRPMFERVGRPAVPPERFPALRSPSGVEQMLFPCLALAMGTASVVGTMMAYLLPV